MGTTAEQGVVAALLDWLEKSTFLYGWQVGWIAYGLSFSVSERASVGAWAADNMFADALPWFARGQAAIAAAISQALPSQSRFFDLFERAPEATKPDLVAAVSLSAASWKDRFLHGSTDSPLLAAVGSLPRDQSEEWR